MNASTFTSYINEAIAIIHRIRFEPLHPSVLEEKTSRLFTVYATIKHYHNDFAGLTVIEQYLPDEITPP